MHDVFEGIANYTMTNICNDFIYKQKIFTLDFSNQQITLFHENASYISNKIPLIKKTHFTSKHKLKMSSAEMINFTSFFGLLVGDKVEPSNEKWQLFLLLRKIINILMSPRTTKSHVAQLTILIPEFLSLYKTHYGNLQLKFHNMIHIVRVLKRNGPLVHYWSMRMESKHRELKLAVTATNSSTNLLKTISLRSQLKLAYSKIMGSMIPTEIDLNEYENIDDKIRLCYFSNLKNEKIVSANSLEFKGIEYKVGMVFVTDMGDNDLLKFGKIEQIFIVKNKVFVLLQPLTMILFDEHIFAYEVISRNAHELKNVDDFCEIHPCTIIKKNESLFVISKYIL